MTADEKTRIPVQTFFRARDLTKRSIQMRKEKRWIDPNNPKHLMSYDPVGHSFVYQMLKNKIVESCEEFFDTVTIEVSIARRWQSRFLKVSNRMSRSL